MPLMSNVGRHGSSRLNSKCRCISHCSRFASMPAFARAVRPLAAGEPSPRCYQVRVSARSGCPSYGGQRTARSVRATRSLANARLFAEASQCQACASARRRSRSSQGRARGSFSASSSIAWRRLLVIGSKSKPSWVQRPLSFARKSSTAHAVQLAAAVHSSRAKSKSLAGAAVPLFFACRPTPPSSGRPSAAAHVER